MRLQWPKFITFLSTGSCCLLFLLLPCSFFPLPTAMHSGKCTACVSVAGIPQLRVTISNSTSRTTFMFAVTTKGKTSIKASNVIRARELYLAYVLYITQARANTWLVV
uniref:Putative uncharacterized protein YOR024W n=1 Tax=Saccharomyces cerevisiae (strain ATCC 204508 / S288c) TaxID=559292 RepID=YOR24_YEAST|nr:RecName: Full=Putative uncharacterized protein YOR024W; Flags: Precursor [Saccharomyces cerevisiae S288C]CAA60773.1 ORF OR26.14 [Saccharomyces cerevisiae]CAA99214.1 unnamed protein product [Saccharomyces cerevisiae]